MTAARTSTAQRLVATPDPRFDPPRATDPLAALAAAIDTVLKGRALAPDDTTALGMVGAAFGLGPTEVGLLALTAGAELDDRVERAIGGDVVTFEAVRPLLPELGITDIHRSSRLRRARLLDVDDHHPLRCAPIHIDLDVLALLVGRPSLADALRPVLRLVSIDEVGAVDETAVDELLSRWFGKRRSDGVWTVVLLGGPAAESVAAHAAEEAGFGLAVLDARVLRNDPRVIAELAALWSREAALHRAALLVDASGLPAGADTTPLDLFLQRVQGPVAMSGWAGGRSFARTMVRLDVGNVTAARRRDWWQRALGEQAPRFSVERLAQHFPLSAGTIGALVAAVDLDDDDAPARLWRSSRLSCRGGLDDLATRIERQHATADAPGNSHDPAVVASRLVVPRAVERRLDAIVARVVHQAQVYDEWAWPDAGRARGVVAVFAGPSGTGKTLAAETIAARLGLDLYRIDLATTVSKWIGETEKHLAHLFDAAESSGAVLLFDEADAVFGRRTEVRDSHDRYANLEVSYLLQRLESYNGLAILTTNMDDAIDQAFRRRFAFVIEFPVPGVEQRRQLWEGLLPPDAVDDRVDLDVLGQLSITGGSIANIALDAAFRAAAEHTSINMRHLREAAIEEYAKSDRSLTAGELKGFES